jgi:hypothetical protein
MPIARYLSDSTFTPEQRQFLATAFEYTLRRLNLADRNDPLCDLIAHTIIGVGKASVTDAVVISDIAVRKIGAS